LTLLLPDALLGVQRPRVHSGPKFKSSAGAEAVALSAELGLFLDPWQGWVLEQSLGEKPDGRWAAWQVCLLCPRQNGKGSILEARELAGLFLFGEQRMTHSAHEAKTAKEHFERMETLLRDAGYGDDLVTYRRSTTEVSITVKSTGCKLIFYTRTATGGRGLSGDVVVLDEAFALTREQMAALMPTMSARSIHGNPQMWFTSSAGFAESEVLAQKKIQGEQGSDRLAYFDWSAVPGSSLTDRAVWAQANPGMGLRISEEFIAGELPDLGPEGFGRERLGLWDEFAVVQKPVTEEAWERTAKDVYPAGGPVFFVTVAKRMASASVNVAALHHGVPHVELADHRPDVDWLTDRLRQLHERHPGAKFAAWEAGPVKAWKPTLAEPYERDGEELAGFDLELLGQSEAGSGCAHLEKLAKDLAFTHSPDDVYAKSLAGAATRELEGGGWVWAWRSSTSDVAPIAGATGALWLLETQPTYDVLNSVQ
jgi:hypothetical protein